MEVVDLTEGKPPARGTFRAAVLHLGAQKGDRESQESTLEDLRVNTENAHQLIRAAHARGAQIVITPEYGNTGNQMKDAPRDWTATCLPEPPSNTPLHELELEGLHPYVKDYAKLAAELDIWIVTGVIECVKAEPENKYYNVGLVLDNKGRVVARYRKINLWVFTESHMDAGNEQTVFESPFGRFGMLICSDALYPNLWSDLVQEHRSDFLIMQSYWMPSPYIGSLAMNAVAGHSGRTVLWSNHPNFLAGGAGFVRPGVANDDSVSTLHGPGVIITDLPLPDRMQEGYVASMAKPEEPDGFDWDTE